MFTIAICDDNQEFVQQELSLIKKHLDSHSIEHKILTFSSGVDLISYAQIKSFDLVLLDYEMDGLTGFETAKVIRDKSNNTCIAFVTVFYEFSREGYKFDAIRYLIKQESTFEKELQDCINKAYEIKNKTTKRTISIAFIDKTITLSPNQIMYIQADKHYLNFYILIENNLVCYKKRDKLSFAVNILSASNVFAQPRTGVLLNMNYIVSIDKKDIIYMNHKDYVSKIFRLSDSFKTTFLSRYMKHLGE